MENYAKAAALKAHRVINKSIHVPNLNISTPIAEKIGK